MVRGIVSALFVAALAGCADMRSVRAVAAVGQSLAPFDADIRTLDETCQLERSLQITRKCPVHNEEWSSVLAVLVRYSDELSRATGATATIQPMDPAWPPWRPPVGDRKPDVGELGDAVRNFLSRDASQASVALAVNQADSSLQSVVERLIGRIEFARNDLQRVRCTVACRANAPLDRSLCPSVTPEECVQPDESRAALLADLLQRLAHRDDGLAELGIDLRTFAMAHHQLATHVRELTSRAAYEAVVTEINGAVPRSVEAALPPATEGGGR